MASAQPEAEPEWTGLPDGYRAVVLGSTGATGRELVAELVASPRCGAVVCVTRRALGGLQRGAFPLEHVQACFPNAHNPGLEKLEIAVVDWEALTEQGTGADIFGGSHFVACCLGTTKADSGADGFRRCDLDYTSAAAKYAQAAGTVKQYSLLTSAGASSGSWIAYLKVKGLQEEAAKALFGPPEQPQSRLSIFRPGALDRGAELRAKRGKERFMGAIGMKGLPVVTLAKAMLVDAETCCGGPAPVLDGSQIKAIVAQGLAAKS